MGSERSSRAESGIGMTGPESDKEEVSEPESPKPRRRRRNRRGENDKEDTGRDNETRYSRRRGPVIGQAPNPNFDKVKPKIDNHGQQRQQRHNRVKIYDDKSYMRKAKEAHRGHRTRRNEPEEEDIKPREGRRDRHKSR